MTEDSSVLSVASYLAVWAQENVFSSSEVAMSKHGLDLRLLPTGGVEAKRRECSCCLWEMSVPVWEVLGVDSLDHVSCWDGRLSFTGYKNPMGIVNQCPQTHPVFTSGLIAVLPLSSL